MGYYFYFPSENKIVVARYAELFEKNLITQEVSGRAVDLEEIQDDTSPSEITRKISMEVEGFEPPQEEVIPIRRPEMTHQAPDRLCLDVEMEEHSLEDLNEPANYKAAMLDSESNKWIDAMNAEIKSMIDNMKVGTSTRWVKSVPSKVNITAWKIKTNALPTIFNLSRREMDIDTLMCPVCKGGVETTSYLFFQCVLSKQIMCKVSSWWNIVRTNKLLFDNKTPKKALIFDNLVSLSFNLSKGYTQVYEIDYEETFSPVANIRAIRILISIAMFCDYEIWQMDVKTTFLNGYLDEDIYIVQPEGFVDPNHLRKRSAKQITIAMSSTEAEYTVAAEASMEVVCIRKFIDGLGIVMPSNKRPMEMLCDNEPAIVIANDLGILKGSIYFQRKYHYIREVIQEREIFLKKVHTDDNVADPFTKPIPFNKHYEHDMAIRIVIASSLM
nr:retrovirus-related Pol polyprotein from transposon TNT 1-94 [Tanacetum cinerariifolium]